MFTENDFYFDQAEYETVLEIIEANNTLLQEATRNNVYLDCASYEGEVFSYTTIRKPFTAALTALALNEPQEETIDIQTTLGEQGDSLERKLKLSIKSDNVPNYSFVLMYLKHGVGEYPVTIVLDEDISNEINKNYYDAYNSYIYTIDESVELRVLFDRVFASSRLKGILQSLITQSAINKMKDSQ